MPTHRANDVFSIQTSISLLHYQIRDRAQIIRLFLGDLCTCSLQVASTIISPLSMKLWSGTINKSLLSNLFAVFLIVLGTVLPAPYARFALDTGLFALSGGLTNWLAVHMLFERVPGLYGSGVVQIRFEEFKLGIRALIIEQFFEKADLTAFFSEGKASSELFRSRLNEILGELDLDNAFDSLVDVIMASSFGNMISMIGGKDALGPLKVPFSNKMRDYFQSAFADPDLLDKIKSQLSNGLSDDTIREKVASIIDQRLDQLTPQMVKEIVQTMIHKHLGWLVVWGCAFGGVIGFAVSILRMG